MVRRDAILNAVLEADRLHKEFDTKVRAERGEGRVDVFGMLVNRGIPVMFRPLKGLLGAYIDKPDPGVIVTTQRPLPVQRFTAAHELGHVALGHEASLDKDDILTRASSSLERTLTLGRFGCGAKLIPAQPKPSLKRTMTLGRSRPTPSRSNFYRRHG